jgi:pheromone a factor receptor
MSSFLRRAMVCFTTFCILAAFFVFSIASMASTLNPWTSFADVHQQFFDIQVVYLTSLQSPNLAYIQVEWAWWTIPVLSLIFIAYFATSEKVVERYRTIKSWTLPSKACKRPHLKPLVLPIQ